eukprot:172753-Karenia_brevis.AAC.1
MRAVCTSQGRGMKLPDCFEFVEPPCFDEESVCWSPEVLSMPCRTGVKNCLMPTCLSLLPPPLCEVDTPDRERRPP